MKWLNVAADIDAKCVSHQNQTAFVTEGRFLFNLVPAASIRLICHMGKGELKTQRDGANHRPEDEILRWHR